MGGAEHGANPGQSHFTDDAFANLIREVLQNSLDHPEPGLGTVAVTFKTINVDPKDIHAPGLLEHVQASLQEAQRGQSPDTARHYEEMAEMMSRDKIPCLAIVDENTTGLRGENWQNLILREGMPDNTGKVTKGGSMGLGKHAPFNLSACNTVIYSSRYVDKAARGRVCRMAGRSQLMTHEDPAETGARLQNVGFLANHHEGYNQPIEGPRIPGPFQLRDCGTGVFIIGFRGERFPEWVKLATKEILRNFFHAIHVRALEIHLQDGEDAAPSTIDQQGLDAEMEALGEKDRSRHYFQAIRGEPQETRPSGRLGPPKRMKLWTSTDRNAPKRLAHLNRRGMLITDERRTRDNPFTPYGGGSWAPWCAVTMAADEETDRFIRRMEPATHNAVHPGELQDPAEREEATEELGCQRAQIAKMVRDQIERDNTTKSSNITELAELFPDLPMDEGADMEWRESQLPQERRGRTEKPAGTNQDDDEDEGRDEDEDGNEDEGRDEDEDGDENKDTRNTDGGQPRNRRGQKDPGETGSAGPLENSRIIRTSPDSFAASFTMPDARNNTLRLSLRTAGEQHQYNEEKVRAGEVSQTGDLLGRATTEDGDIIVQAPAGTPIVLMISTEGPETRYSGYKLTLQDTGEEI